MVDAELAGNFYVTRYSLVCAVIKSINSAVGSLPAIISSDRSGSLLLKILAGQIFIQSTLKVHDLLVFDFYHSGRE